MVTTLEKEKHSRPLQGDRRDFSSLYHRVLSEPAESTVSETIFRRERCTMRDALRDRESFLLVEHSQRPVALRLYKLICIRGHARAGVDCPADSVTANFPAKLRDTFETRA